MTSLIVLFLCVLLLFAIAMKNAEFIFVPHVGFIAGFLLQVFFCFFYMKEWDINLSGITVWAVIIGNATFLVLSLLSKKYRFKTGKIRVKTYANVELNESVIQTEYNRQSVNSLLLIIFIILQTFTLAWYVYFMMTNMQGSGLAAKIYYYRQQTADYGEVISVPRILSFFRLVSGAIGYVCSFFLARQIIEKLPGKKLLLIINIIVSFGVEGILGARGGMFNFLIAIITEFMIVRYHCTNKKPSLKSLVKFTIIGFGALLIFPAVGAIIGRPDLGPINELAVYIGAPLKNFDTLVFNNISNTDCHASTFSSLLGDLSGYISSINVQNNLLPARWNFVHGHSLGNVYTTFANFWYDLRLGGVVLYSAIMALISQWLFRKALSSEHNSATKGVFLTVMYSYFFSAVLFSFFSNRFYDQFFSLFSIKFVIAVYAVAWLIIHFQVKQKR